MTKKNAVYITHGVRTAIGKIGKSLKDVSDTALSVIVIKNLLEERAKLDAQEIDHVIFGEVKQKSDSANIARAAALQAGIPEKVPAYTVNRQCGSGLQAVSYTHLFCKVSNPGGGAADYIADNIYGNRAYPSGSKLF